MIRSCLAVLLIALTPPATPAAESLTTLNVEFSPNNPKESAQDVDQQVGVPFSHAFSELPNVARLEVRSTPGRCLAVLRFKGAKDEARESLHKKISELTPKLPKESRITMADGDPRQLAQVWVGVTSDTIPLLTLTEISRLFIAKHLSVLPGLNRVNIFSGVKRSVTVDLDPQAMFDRGVTAADVAAAVKGRSPTDISGDIVVHGSKGDIFLRSVANINERAADAPFVEVNGKPGVLLAVAVTGESPPIAARLTELQPKLPNDVHVQLLADLDTDKAILCELRLAEGTSAARARDISRQFIDALRSLGLRWRENATMASESDTVRILFIAPSGPPLHDVMRQIVGRIPAEMRACEVGKGNLNAFPVRLVLSGADPRKLHEWAAAITTRLRSNQFLDGIATSPGPDIPMPKRVIDKDRARQLGIDPAEIDRALANTPPDKPVPNDVFVKSKTVDSVPLSALVAMQTALVPPAILRWNGHLAIEISANPANGHSLRDAVPAAQKAAAAEREALKLPADYIAIDGSN